MSITRDDFYWAENNVYDAWDSDLTVGQVLREIDRYGYPYPICGDSIARLRGEA